MGQDHLAAQIQQQLDTHEDIHALVAEQEGRILLSGTANSAQARKRAAEMAASMAPNRRIVNNLEVEHDLPIDSEGNARVEAGDFGGEEISLSVLDSATEREGIQLDPSLTAQPLETNEIDAMDSGAVDDLDIAEM
ncbi:MAG TPA: BON domain-containing protein [Ktedonobacterales bacterium]|jgi:hypothetical protein